jgi:hypothetical protein
MALKAGLKPLTGFRLKAELRQKDWVRICIFSGRRQGRSPGFSRKQATAFRPG